MMNNIFADLIVEGWVIVYLDDILIYSEHLEEHRSTAKEVLRILQENELFLKPEKCEFEQREVEYLGVIVGNGKIQMDPIKVEGVRQWATPRNIKDVQSFLGFLNFYRRFIKGFGDYAKPLTRLTWKDYKWRWGELEKNAFNQLILAVTSEPVLHFPTDIGEWQVEADSSDYATGACLTQCQNGVWVPIAFMSKGLNNTERNYDIHNMEMLVIMRALYKW
jgi:hypothetical protein